MARPALALTLAAALLAGCGDPVVVLGDWPGYMRVVLGVPGSAGSATDTVATRTRLVAPHGVAAAPDGALYVGDESGRVVRVSPAGRADEVYPPAAGCSPCMQQPAGMDVDSTALWIADPAAGRVWRLDLKFLTLQAVAGSGGTASGPDGPALTTSLAQPGDVAIDGAGRVYFSERAGNRVRRIDADGSLHTVVGTGSAGYSGDGGPGTAAQLNGPVGLAAHGTTLFISDAGNQRVRALDLASGVIRTIAGNGISGFSGDDGPATAASLANPLGLAATADGRTLFIADLLNRRVRAVDLGTGVIRTFAGNGGSVFSGTGRAAAETALAQPVDVAASPFQLLFIVDATQLIVWRTPLGI